jgi:hypothetical protein
MHVACIALLAAACAGPLPSVSPESSSPEPSEIALASPSAPPASPSSAPSFSPTTSPVPTETPVASPSYEPDPTPEGALPHRTEVEINPYVVERAGVPPELHDQYWWTPYGDAGPLGTTAQIGLPSDERIITVAEGLVVSADVTYAHAHSIYVRDFKTGELLRQIPTGLSWPQGAVIQGRLFWTGLIPQEGNEKAIDGGVWFADARNREAPAEIVAAGKGLGGWLCGRNLVVSPTAKTMAATASCFGWKGWTDIINVDSQAPVRRIVGANAWAITDDAYALPDSAPSDGLAFGQGGMTAHDIATDALLWRYPDPSNLDRFALLTVMSRGNSFIVESNWDMGNDTEIRITLFQPTTGQHRVLLKQSTTNDVLHLDQSASSANYVVLTTWDRPIDIDGTAISIVRIADAVLLRDVFVIDPPFICSNEWCFRD